jgi:diguanylate cyclase (GGDEF)-like protein/PAS domain S-box-containing protein
MHGSITPVPLSPGRKPRVAQLRRCGVVWSYHVAMSPGVCPDRSGIEEHPGEREQALEWTLGASLSAAFAAASDGGVFFLNAAARARWPSAEPGTPASSLFPEEARAQFDAIAAEVVANGSPGHFECAERGPAGVRSWARFALSPLRDPVGANAFLCIASDLTELKRSQERALRSEQLMVDTQGVAHLGTWEWDISETIAVWSEELYRIYGLNPQTYTPSYENYLALVHPEDRQRVMDATNRVFHEHVPYSHDERVFRPDGSVRYLHTWAHPVLDDDGKLVRLLGVCQDITDRKLAEIDRERIQAELAYRSNHDAVTTLERYSVLQPRLDAMISSGTGAVSVLLVDVDGFQGINEAIGHERADRVLRVVAGRLRTWASDRVAISHLAGDEFAIAVAGGDEASVLALAEEMRAAIAEPIDDRGFHLVLSATVGVSRAEARGSTSTELLRRAQAAKERGKDLGGDCVSVFLPEQMQAIEDRMTLGGLLRAAARAGEFQLHYQPQFHAGTGEVKGFEALLRWDSPKLGPVPPNRFIPVAESLGLMPEIGTWVIREACRQARLWLDAGHAGFAIAVNVSAHQLRRPGLVGVVTQALADSGVPARTLEIELTESSLLDSVARVQGILAELKALGVTLSLDDFGTGYSSLAYLKNFSLDKLKIDRSFVRGLPDDADDAAIARTIVSIGHQLGLLVNAEGVETPAQREFLCQIGCDELQGYLFGRPCPAATAEAAFRAG